MLIPHIHCFVLVFSAVLISAVHALPTPFAAIEPIAPRSPILPGSVTPGSRSHSEAGEAGPSQKPLLKDEWPKEYRVTILDYTLDMAKLPININLHVTKPDEFPAVHPRVRNWAAKTVSTVLSIAVDKKITYTNPSPKEPQPRKHASTNLLEKMAVFVVEAKYDTAICGGKWPCIGWRRSVSDSKPAFYSMYPINPDVLEPKRLHFDGYKNQEEAQGKQFDIDFWKMFPRREFESKWPVLKEAIDHQHRERMAEVRKKSQDKEKKKWQAEVAKAKAKEAKEMKERMDLGNILGSTTK